MKFTETYSFKMIVIAVLAFLLLIPTFFIRGTIQEREARKSEAIEDISSKWGKEQLITGPFLTVPYKKYYLDSANQKKYYLQQYHILPNKLSIHATLSPEVRYRGIYETVLYKSKLSIQSEIEVFNNVNLDSTENEILWKKSEINVGISDLKGIANIRKFSINGEVHKINPGINSSSIIDQGLSVHLNEVKPKLVIELEIDLNGSENIGFYPVGEITEAEVDGAWKNPSFKGAYLPFSRSLSDSSFSAKWKILHLNRNYPQSWEGDNFKIIDSDFKVELLLTSEIYQKTTRVIKYALLFILITFVGFFFSEVINRKRIHPIQYLLVGFSILLFYVLLLSISEHVNFGSAYLISSIMTVLLVGLYSRSILSSNIFGVYIGFILIILYSYYYILIQLQDYSLLIGSIGLFVVLSLFMFFTRKINWYKLQSTE